VFFFASCSLLPSSLPLSSSLLNIFIRVLCEHCDIPHPYPCPYPYPYIHPSAHQSIKISYICSSECQRRKEEEEKSPPRERHQPSEKHYIIILTKFGAQTLNLFIFLYIYFILLCLSFSLNFLVSYYDDSSHPSGWLHNSI